MSLSSNHSANYTTYPPPRDDETLTEYRERSKMEARRQREVERHQRIILDKTRPVFTHVLQAQVEEKAIQEEMRVAEEMKWAREQAEVTRYIKGIEMEAAQEKEARRRELGAEWQRQAAAKEEARREEKERGRQVPVRETQGASSMQTFIGDDPLQAERKRLQAIQLRQWTQEQVAVKDAEKARQREEERAYAESQAHLASVREKIAVEEEQQRKALNRKYATENASLAAQKVARRVPSDSEARHLSFALTTEESAKSALGSHRRRKDHYAGMSREEEEAIRMEQQNQIVAKEKKRREDEEEKRRQSEEARQLNRMTTEFERMEMEERARRGRDLRETLERQRKEQSGQEEKRKAESKNHIQPGFFDKFGATSR